jgi:hypothetical protein
MKGYHDRDFIDREWVWKGLDRSGILGKLLEFVGKCIIDMQIYQFI